MANGDIYMLTDVAYNNDQQNLNVYFYRRDSLVAVSDNEAENLAEQWIADVLPRVLAIQNTSVLHTAVQVKNLFDPTDAWVELISAAGTVTNADESPVMLALDVGLEHNNAAIRQGRKAYGGLDESAMSNGVVVGSGFIANLALLMAELVTGVPIGVIDTFFPVIVARILDGLTYRLPVDQGEATYGSIQTATYNPVISTQNSRKIGRGV